MLEIFIFAAILAAATILVWLLSSGRSTHSNDGTILPVCNNPADPLWMLNNSISAAASTVSMDQPSGDQTSAVSAADVCVSNSSPDAGCCPSDFGNADFSNTSAPDFSSSVPDACTSWDTGSSGN